MKTVFSSAFILLCAFAAQGQVVPRNAMNGNGAPPAGVGQCLSGNVTYRNNLTGEGFECVNNTWQLEPAVTVVMANSTLSPANITQDSTHRFATDAEKSIWNAKQPALGFTAVPDTRTVNGQALSSNVLIRPSVVYNQSTASQGPGFATDTYIAGSSVLIPAGSLKSGTRYHAIIRATKTAAGIAAPVLVVRFGVNGTTADAARVTLTFTAQTAAIDTGTFELWLTFNAVGASAVINGVAQRRHGASITGFGTLVGESLQATSVTFDSTVANSIIGVSVNGGASAAWTLQLVQVELSNLQ